MTVNVNLADGQWKQLNTVEKVFITGGPFFLFLGGNKAPTADDTGHRIDKEIVIPQDCGAWIRGGFGMNGVVASVLNAATDAPANPIK